VPARAAPLDPSVATTTIRVRAVRCRTV
jgi:hypothetical protein